MDTKPLLSDEIAYYRDPLGRATILCDDELLGLHNAAMLLEAARAEDAKLIQSFVDAVSVMNIAPSKLGSGFYTSDGYSMKALGALNAALSAAAARNFKPSQP